MQLELSEQELEALRKLIDRELADLNPEIHHTYTTALRDELRAYRQALNDLRAKLGTA
jgi:hypothetical protein